jgi:sec-independent protein translocase protein TatC
MAGSTYDDVPMSLGDHLEELRRRLVWPIITLGLAFFTAFAFEARLQEIFVKPLEWAYHINPENAQKVGMALPIKLKALEVMEAVMASMTVSFYAAFFVTFPVLVYHLWKFISVGLLSREKRLAFLFVPAGIMFFYAGTMVGYFIGLPAFYSFMIKWAAHNPIVQFDLQLKTYHHNFVMMTMVFGLVADIPWLIMVIVRVGFVSVEQLLRHWKISIFICTAIAAVVAPPDALSMVIMMVPLFGLFFLGVGLSALMMRRHHRLEAKEQAEELKRMEEEERAAHEAHAHHAAQHDTPVVDPNQTSPTVHLRADPDPANEPKPIPRGSITDDLASGDHAPSSDDHAVPDPSSPDAGPADGGTPRKDDDRV